MRRQLINFPLWRYRIVVFNEIERNLRPADAPIFPVFHSNWLNRFIYLFIYFYIHKPRNRRASLGNAGWRNTAARRRESVRLLPK